VANDHLIKLSPEARAHLRELFLDEAVSLVEQLETSLLALEESAGDQETINEAFRAAHTIKGSAAASGFAEVAAFTHELEFALQAVRSHQVVLDVRGVAILLEGVDLLRDRLVAAGHDSSLPRPDEYFARLAEVFPPPAGEVRYASVPPSAGQREPTDLAVHPPPQGSDRPGNALDGISAAEMATLQSELQAGATLFTVFWILPEEAFTLGLDPLALINALADEATIIRVTPLLSRLPPPDMLDPVKCYLGFSTLVATHGTTQSLRAVFEFCPDDSYIEVAPLDLPQLQVAAAAPLPATMLPNREGALTPAARMAAAEAQTIRVKQAQLDNVINLVGEMATARNALLHLQRVVEMDYDLPDLARRLKNATIAVNWTVNRLQADVLAMRMIPVRMVFQRLPRVVHDVAASGGKQVALRMSGEETELDKTVADALVDPLTHLVRNAVDHGIETPVERQASGKPGEGSVTIGAERRGNNVVIAVSDDGGGIDLQRLRQAAVSKGFLEAAAAERLSDADTIDLIFAAGFSTARVVSDVSGRGVGMDAVRTSVARMGGSVSVESRLGEGTTFRLELPLTLSLFRGLLMRAGGETFAIPLDAVRETTNILPSACQHLIGHAVAPLRGQSVGLVSLAGAMGLENGNHHQQTEDEEGWPVVMVEAGGQQVGLIVEAVDSPQDIMVKPIEEYLSVEGTVAGASIMGDGRVALVLDPANLVRYALAYARHGRCTGMEQ
jgi:two-component system chemotaxis sensor kinase CheA